MTQVLRGITVATILAAGMLGGCADKDNTRKWNGAPAVAMSDEAAASMIGRWEGHWESNTNYDRGLAHAVIYEVPAPAESTAKDRPHYKVHFTLWHYELAPEEFDVILTTTPGLDGKINFYGERVLSADDGVSKFDGFIRRNKLYLTFTSRRDYGTLSVIHLVG
jgi:hypothetical protein